MNDNNMMNGQQPYTSQGQYQPQGQIYQGQMQPQGQMYQGQVNQPQGQPFQMPGQNYNEPPKKGHAGLVILGIICVFLLVGVVAVAGFFVYKKVKSGGSDDDIQAAMKNTFAISDHGAMDDVLHYKELSEKVNEKGIAMDMNFRIDEIQGENIGSPSVKMHAEADIENKAVDMQGSVSAGGITIDGIEYYYDENSMILNVPILYDKAFEIDYSGDFSSKLRSSELASMVGDDELLQNVEDIVDAIKTGLDNSMPLTTDTEQSESCFDQVSDIFFEKAKTEKIDSEEIELDGKDVKCKGYRLTVDHDDLQEISEPIIDWMKEIEPSNMDSIEELLKEYHYDSSSEDSMYKVIKDAVKEMDELTMDVYLYQGQVAKIDCKLEIDNGNELTINYVSNGGDILAQNMVVDLTVVEDGEESNASLSRETESSDDEYTTKWVVSGDGSDLVCKYSYQKEDKEFSLDIDAFGEVGMILKGTVNSETDDNIDLSFDKFEMTQYGSTLLKMSGDLKYSALEEDVEKPSCETVDVLEMSQYDWFDVYMSVSSALD